jgi:hypothetical protein
VPLIVLKDKFFLKRVAATHAKNFGCERDAKEKIIRNESTGLTYSILVRFSKKHSLMLVLMFLKFYLRKTYLQTFFFFGQNVPF